MDQHFQQAPFAANTDQALAGLVNYVLGHNSLNIAAYGAHLLHLVTSSTAVNCGVAGQPVWATAHSRAHHLARAWPTFFSSHQAERRRLISSPAGRSPCAPSVFQRLTRQGIGRSPTCHGLTLSEGEIRIPDLKSLRPGPRPAWNGDGAR